LVDQIFPKIPIRQWVLSFPFPLRYLLAVSPKVQSAILKIRLRAITGWLRKKARAQDIRDSVETGAVTLIQRFGGSINLNLHFHMLVLEGVYVGKEEPTFLKLPAPTDDEVKALVRTLSIRTLRWLIRHGHFDSREVQTPPSAVFRLHRDSCLLSIRCCDSVEKIPKRVAAREMSVAFEGGPLVLAIDDRKELDLGSRGAAHIAFGNHVAVRTGLFRQRSAAAIRRGPKGDGIRRRCIIVFAACAPIIGSS